MKVLVFGATDKKDRYAYIATSMLLDDGHEVVLFGKRNTTVLDHEIHTEKKDFQAIDTITMYVNPQNQIGFEDYILSLKPKRIIFNPGTENIKLEKMAAKNGVKVERACTLVMLRTNQF